MIVLFHMLGIEGLDDKYHMGGLERVLPMYLISLVFAITERQIYLGDNAKDAAGILACEAAGKKCMVLTGRETYAVGRRAKDLHMAYVFQGIKDIQSFLKEFIIQNGYAREKILYIGDDLNDIGAMKIAGRTGCPADAAEEVKQTCDYVSSYNGGNGAVRDILFTLLKSEGIYENAIEKAYGGV